MKTVSSKKIVLGCGMIQSLTLLFAEVCGRALTDFLEGGGVIRALHFNLLKRQRMECAHESEQGKSKGLNLRDNLQPNIPLQQ